MRTLHKAAWLAAALLLAEAPGIRAEVQLSSVFMGDCVLQRDVPVPVWGCAEPGDEITVRFDGKAHATTADGLGRWRVELGPMPASAEGRALEVTGPDSAIRVPDVYVGDVFLELSPGWYVGEEPKLAPGDPSPVSLPPLCVLRPGSVHESQNHSVRPAEDYGSRGGPRWGRYRSGSKYFASDAFYLGVGLASRTRAPVGVLGVAVSSLESMTPPEGFLAYRAELGLLAETVTSWVPRTRTGREAYLQSLAAIERWVQETRPKLEEDGSTYRDFAQPPRLPGPPAHQRAPTTLYNRVIHRFAPMAIRGVIIRPATYNAGDPRYGTKARALIAGLRAVFGHEDLPVCFVQMHSPTRYERREALRPEEWVELRREQARLAGFGPTTVIATYDLHDRDTLDVDCGRRVAAWAAHVATGEGEPTGPTYRSHSTDGARIVVELDRVGAGLMVGTSTPGEPVRPAPEAILGGFELAGEDGEWHEARATIDGARVVVESDAVAKPTGVRYAWAPEPLGANLYNQAGFPALPFEAPWEP